MMSTYNINNIKCALIAVAKNEEQFLDEWVNYHLKLGFDHIYLCDNNDESEKLEYNHDNVTILYYNHITTDIIKENFFINQKNIYNEVIDNIYNLYDYCGICDIDEFFYFNGLTVKEIIEQEIIEKNNNCLEIPWKTYNDNNIIYNSNELVQDIYIKESNKIPFDWCNNEYSYGKIIFKLSHKGIKMHGPHYILPDSYDNLKTYLLPIERGCVKHYRTKCLENYLEHKVKQLNFDVSLAADKNIIQKYFYFNEVTNDKIKYIKNWIDVNKYDITDTDKKFLYEFDNINNIKCALIAVARDEDVFLDEWINYHLLLGFDHIYICDNNDIQNKLNIKHNKVTVYNFNDIDFSINGIYTSQSICYNNVLNDIWDKYDYCGICDIDEFFYFNKYDLKKFILEYLISTNRNVAEIPWKVYDDNDLIYHINKPIQELYTRECNKMPFDWCKNECSWGKSIFKLCEDIKANPHWPEPNTMNNLGGFKTNHINKNVACVKHYRTKCLEDYISHKVKNGNFKLATFNITNDVITPYFKFNDISIEKLLTGLELCKKYGVEISENDKYFIFEQFKILKPITVVIRTHNRINFLKKCIDNINNQTCIPEILVLDDNSNDCTSIWLSENNIQHMKLNKHIGPGEILMRGRHMITTPYYIILDSDDKWNRDDVIEQFYKEIINNINYDIYGDGQLHINYLVKTELLLKCPMTSAWASDDWYWCWIEHNGSINRDVSIKGFYTYIHHNNDFRASKYNNNIIKNPLFDHYNEKNKDNILYDIREKYHKGILKDRKVFDQIIKYCYGETNFY